MIRLFAELCKTKLESLSEEAILQNAADEFNYYGEKCPNCGATGTLSPYGDYPRYLISYKSGKITVSLVRPLRFECKPSGKTRGCGTTHALLPDILIPYSPYSLRFMLTVLVAYFERETTVVAICEHFGIAVSTLYAWKERLYEHKALLLGELTSREKPALAFLHGLLGCDCLSDHLSDFFNRHGFSFMQDRLRVATRSVPP